MLRWEIYSQRFRLAAEKRGFDEQYVSICLRYAEPLYRRGLPVIYDQQHFAALVGYEFDYVRGAYYSGSKYYRRFSINKRSGGAREIAEPLPNLKLIQRWILENILYKCQPSRFAKGFVPRRSIRENARFHRGQSLVLSLDLKDFFPSIRGGRVYKFFRRLGYQNKVAHMLTKLCTLNNSLPQGAPTSPALSNLISLRLDRRLAGLALKERLRYTRYADDMTFSGEFDPGRIIRFVRVVSAAEGYTLNESKTRLMERHQRQEVTGVVVNSKLQAPRDKRREFRQIMYFIDKYGLDSHLAYTHNSRGNYLKHLLGIANYFLFINPKDKYVRESIRRLHELLEESVF
jgi:RNA-directed DNA polymerase